jgi:hypothetical protein
LQAIGVNAAAKQGYRVDSFGTAVPTAEPIDDFHVQNLAFQIRYRFEIAPLSYLYVVYGRGGYNQALASDDLGSIVTNSFSLRDDDQILVKFSYRFEL